MKKSPPAASALLRQKILWPEQTNAVCGSFAKVGVATLPLRYHLLEGTQRSVVWASMWWSFMIISVAFLTFRTAWRWIHIIAPTLSSWEPPLTTKDQWVVLASLSLRTRTTVPHCSENRLCARHNKSYEPIRGQILSSLPRTFLVHRLLSGLFLWLLNTSEPQQCTQEALAENDISVLVEEKLP